MDEVSTWRQRWQAPVPSITSLGRTLMLHAVAMQCPSRDTALPRVCQGLSDRSASAANPPTPGDVCRICIGTGQGIPSACDTSGACVPCFVTNPVPLHLGGYASAPVGCRASSMRSASTWASCRRASPSAMSTASSARRTMTAPKAPVRHATRQLAACGLQPRLEPPA